MPSGKGPYMNVANFGPALVLNADFRPLNYFPLSLWSWQDTVKAVCLDRVTILSEYEQSISSPSIKLALPSVIALKAYVAQKPNPAFTRFNVFLRDRFCCQYCGTVFSASNLTFDHVLPRSKGGRTNWENVVAACSPCNFRKGNKISSQCNMQPMAKPGAPNVWQLQENGRAFPPNHLHKSWRDYLYWDSELQSDD